MNAGPQPGQYQFPFQMTLPPWLPESMLIADTSLGNGKAISLECRYKVISQLEPVD